MDVMWWDLDRLAGKTETAPGTQLSVWTMTLPTRMIWVHRSVSHEYNIAPDLNDWRRRYRWFYFGIWNSRDMVDGNLQHVKPLKCWVKYRQSLPRNKMQNNASLHMRFLRFITRSDSSETLTQKDRLKLETSKACICIYAKDHFSNAQLFCLSRKDPSLR